MNKAELIDALANESNMSKADAKKAFETTLDLISKSLKKGDRVAIAGFGSFTPAERAARTGRNPKTGGEVKIPAKTVVKFKAGSELLDKMN